MSLLPQLVQLRQQTLDKFLVEKTLVTDDVREFGVNRIAGAELARDPVVFTKLMTLPGCVGATAHACASALGDKIAESMNLLDFTFQKISSIEGRETRFPRYGVSLIRFDRLGALFAVASSSGLIRVFDFDEVLREKSSFFDSKHVVRAPIQAVVALDTRKPIADMQWSFADSSPDYLFVSYLYDTDIDVYDLSDVSAYGIHSGMPIIKLQIQRAFSSMAGHTALCEFTGNRLLAGSSCGQLRLWCCESSRLIWEVDVADTINDKHAVVRIHLCSNDTSSSSLSSSGVYIVVVTRSGLVSVWDPSQLTVKAFGKSRIPLLLYRYCLWDCENYVIVRDREDCVIGVESIPLCQEKLLVTLRSTFCLEIDILHRECRVLSYEDFATERNRVGEDQAPHAADNIKPSYIQIPASVLMSLGASRTVVSVSKNSPNTIFFCNAVPHRPVLAAQATVLRQRISGNGMLLTLPGRVSFVERGSLDLVTTHDLREFLVPLELLSKDKSCHILVDWSSARERDTDETVSDTQGEIYTVAAVSRRGIRLDKPYQGPHVEKGFPRVTLRTDLVCSGSDIRLPSKISKSPHLIPIPAPVTALALSLTHLHIVIGTSDDEVLVLSTLDRGKED